MTSRFQIQEMVSQDATRVVFLAEEEATGERVALRRFISADEAGESREGFLEAIASISELRHPSLRAVVEGGVDPVDGVPFVATEWIEGEVLGQLLENAVLSEDDGLVMVFQALDLLGVVQAHSGTRANWLEFRADDIVVRQTDEGPRFTFWTTLARWLSEQKGKEAVAELASLVGTCCGVSAGAAPPGSRLGDWLRYVRDNEPSVPEAMGALKAMAQLEDKPVAPTRVLTKSPFPAPGPAALVQSRPAPVVKQGSPATGLLVTVSIVVVVGLLALVGFLVVKSREQTPQVAGVEEPAGEKPVEGMPPAAVDPVKEPSLPEQPPEVVVGEPPETVSSANDAIAARARALMEEQRRLRERTEFAASEGEDIALKRGETVTVTGKVAEVRETTSYLYFEFGAEREAGDLCIRMAKASAPGKSLPDFKRFEGESMTFRGRSEIYGPWNRVCLLLDSPDQISASAGE